LFGDVHDPASAVSQAIRERGGYSLMPEWETKPANQYLPRQPRQSVDTAATSTREDPRAIDGALEPPHGGNAA
jgi:hypothetical protein